jgi:hypothetical protein
MSHAVELDQTRVIPQPGGRQHEITIFQIADDGMLLRNRRDRTGWHWCWADSQRDWMDATPNRFAYRCLPLVIANQTGLWIQNPAGFTATWHGHASPGSIDFQFDESAEVWSRWITNEFGAGIVTWSTPFLFRTKPAGSRLLVCGPANYFKDNAHPLTAIIESDWMTMSFTMNWKLFRPGLPTRFELGEPLLQAIPLFANACAELEAASVVYKKLDDDPEVAQAYREWDRSRSAFRERSRAGDVKPDEWQRDYFLGRDASGRQSAAVHMTKVKPPKVSYAGTAAAPGSTNATDPRAEADSRLADAARQARSDTARGPIEGGNASRPVAALLRARDTEAGADGTAMASRPIDDPWRRWIAENLMLGAAPEAILEVMVKSGLSPLESEAEIDRAARSPYVSGVERVCNRLKKREWLLAAYRKLNRLHPGSGAIDRRHKLARGEFIANYYCANRPVIITGMMDDWPALCKWSLAFFAEKFGDREVEVQLGRNAGDDFEAEREKYRRKMVFAQFIDKVKTAGVTNDFYITANNNSANKEALPELWDDIIQIPEYLDGSAPHDGFFWFGPAGTITPFHHDLTNNFMAQVIGRKRILLAPSWDMPLLRNLFDVYCEIDGRVTAPAPRPSFGQPQILECYLEPGQVLFLPVGCLHFVEALEISATVSFTNFLFDDNDFTSFYERHRSV